MNYHPLADYLSRGPLCGPSLSLNHSYLPVRPWRHKATHIHRDEGLHSSLLTVHFFVFMSALLRPLGKCTWHCQQIPCLHFYIVNSALPGDPAVDKPASCCWLLTINKSHYESLWISINCILVNHLFFDYPLPHTILVGHSQANINHYSLAIFNKSPLSTNLNRSFTISHYCGSPNILDYCYCIIIDYYQPFFTIIGSY